MRTKPKPYVDQKLWAAFRRATLRRARTEQEKAFDKAEADSFRDRYVDWRKKQKGEVE